MDPAGKPARQDDKSATPGKHRWKRWRLILFYSVVGCLVLLVVTGWLGHLDTLPSPISILFKWGSEAPVWFFPALALSCGVLRLFPTPEGRVRWKRFRNLAFHPPLWIASVLACLTAFSVIVLFSPIQRALAAPPGSVGDWPFVYLWAWAVIPALLSVCATSWLLQRPKKTASHSHREKQKGLPKTFPEICEWLKDDWAIRTSEDDLFLLEPMAIQIADRLRVDPPESQAVVGAYGSGKTSLGNMVKRELDEVPNIRWIQVELWLYETPRAAVAGILGHVVNTLEKETPLPEYRGLPEDYADAISSAGGLWTTLGSLLQKPRCEPTELLKRLDDVAQALRIRLVLWIEDLERFAGRDPGKPTEAAHGESERLAPLRALIHALGKQKAITVILATTTLEGGLDLGKVARYVEEIRIPHGKVAEVLDVFRRGCLEGSLSPKEVKDSGGTLIESAWIDVAKPEGRAYLDELASYGKMESHGDLGLYSVADLLPLFCGTPRTLKQALHRVWEVWDAKSLRGEVDFDHLLVLTLLREGLPQSYALIRDRFNRISAAINAPTPALVTSSIRRGEEPTTHRYNPINDLVEMLEMSAEKKNALSIILTLLFELPYAQGINAKEDRGERYAKRIFEETIPRDDDRDQPKLKCLVCGSEDERINLLKTSEGQVLSRALLCAKDFVEDLSDGASPGMS